MAEAHSYQYGQDDIEINAGRRKATLKVSNTGDRAIQVGSHFHFFEANKSLLFDREKAYGMHLDLAAGTAVRFEAGDTKEVTLTDFAGTRRLFGFNNLVDGGLDAAETRVKALARMATLGYQHGTPAAGTPQKAPRAKNATATKGKK